jgi:hypothetical protein
VKLKIGDIIISKLDGMTFIIEEIVNEVAVLKSKDGKREVLTGLSNLNLFYYEEVPIMDKGVERRKNVRYLLKDDLIASLHNEKGKVGKVKDISMGGLSLEYIEPVNEKRSNQESLESNLHLWIDDFSLSRVSCRIIYDTPVQLIQSSEYMKYPLNSKNRRCGVQFQTLSDDQNRQLALFLETHTKEILPSPEH